MPHPIPVAYQGPAARHKLSQLRNIPTTNQHDANKDRSLPASHGQLKGEWAPIVCKKVPDPQQTVTGQLREDTGLSAVTPNSLPVPQQSIPDQFHVDQYPQNILRESLTTSTLKPTLDPQDNWISADIYPSTRGLFSKCRHRIPSNFHPDSRPLHARQFPSIVAKDHRHSRAMSSKYRTQAPVNIYSDTQDTS